MSPTVEHVALQIDLRPSASAVRTAMAEVAVLLRSTGHPSRGDLEPAWNAAQALALTRLFSDGTLNEFRSLSDPILLRRLVSMALTSMVSPSLYDYTHELMLGRISTIDATHIFIRLVVTYEWIEDLLIHIGLGVDPFDDAMMTNLRSCIASQTSILRDRMRDEPDVRAVFEASLGVAVRPVPHGLRQLFVN